MADGLVALPFLGGQQGFTRLADGSFAMNVRLFTDLAALIARIWNNGANDGAVYLDPLNGQAYQENTGVTLTTLAGQTVGFWGDGKASYARGAERVTTPNINGVAIGGPVTTLYPTGASILTGPYYEASYTVSGYAGTASVGFQTSRLSPNITAGLNGFFRGISVGVATTTVSMFTRDTNTANFSNISIREYPGNHATQSVAGSRPVVAVFNGKNFVQFDGSDDNLTSATGGGATTGSWTIAVRKNGGDGVGQVIWSDLGTNTGLRIRFDTANRVAIRVGNGASFMDLTSATTVLAGSTCVIRVRYDGAVLYLRIDNGTEVTAAAVLAAGTAQMTVGKNNNVASDYLNGAIASLFYTKDFVPDSADLQTLANQAAASAGITI